MNNKIKHKPLSTSTERIKRTRLTQKNSGAWSGERGNSTYIPDSQQKELIKLLNTFNSEGIKYQDGIPDFSPCALITVELEKMSTSRYRNFKESDILCATAWNHENYLGRNKWTPALVKKHRKRHHLTWHELNDRVSCQLVPTKIHSFFTHLGGIAECKRSEKLNSSGTNSTN